VAKKKKRKGTVGENDPKERARGWRKTSEVLKVYRTSIPSLGGTHKCNKGRRNKSGTGDGREKSTPGKKKRKKEM